jgi:ribose 5-phosphate isomerase B
MSVANKDLRIAIDCDEAAIDLKKVLYDHLKKQGANITDLDYLGHQKADYPEIGFHLAQEIRNAITTGAFLSAAPDLAWR